MAVLFVCLLWQIALWNTGADASLPGMIGMAAAALHFGFGLWLNARERKAIMARFTSSTEVAR